MVNASDSLSVKGNVVYLERLFSQGVAIAGAELAKGHAQSAALQSAKKWRSEVNTKSRK